MCFPGSWQALDSGTDESPKSLGHRFLLASVRISFNKLHIQTMIIGFLEASLQDPMVSWSFHMRIFQESPLTYSDLSNFLLRAEACCESCELWSKILM